jgi:hypothetical protein
MKINYAKEPNEAHKYSKRRHTTGNQWEFYRDDTG